MSDAELRDQLITLLLAGHETTATALAWTFDLLLRNPAVLARLSAEIDAGEASLPAGDDHRVASPPTGGPARRAAPASELGSTATRCPPGPTSRPAIWLTHTRADSTPIPRVPPRALPRRRSRHLPVGPLRRRRPPLPRRQLRGVRDAHRPARGRQPLPSRGVSGGPSASPAATSPSPRSGEPR